ncbi:hypothetical protein ACOCJ4_12370 [Knoellia sp. CPCC 206435]|uniref:hypothetical protein n=1 Tax=Knoellia terrae TaxID=3404797 RepID=UPI003B438E8D
MHWTDPGGRTTDTSPVDHLDRLHLPPPPTTAATCLDEPPPPHDPTVDPGLVQTLLELTLTRLLHLAQADTRPRPPVRTDWVTEPHQGRPLHVDLPGAPPPPKDDPPF